MFGAVVFGEVMDTGSAFDICIICEGALGSQSAIACYRIATIHRRIRFRMGNKWFRAGTAAAMWALGATCSANMARNSSPLAAIVLHGACIAA